jgi:2-polyprenyl-3-methyl-5-hydroxy-6-metoxy-1,4-benzoquinol methylase
MAKDAVMAKYVWQHDLKDERNRLRLMSDLLDPSSEFHLLRAGVTTGWRCLEIGAGNGSLSQWLAQRVGPLGHVIASDIRTDLMEGIAGGNLEVRKFDVADNEPPDAPYDLITIRALLHHLPERRAVVSNMARWLKPGGRLFIQEPDFYPTWTVDALADHHRTRIIDPVHLEHRLRNIKTNRANLVHGRLPSMWFASTQPPYGTSMPQSGRRPQHHKLPRDLT